MTTALVPVKMTEAERDLVDWLMVTTGLLSRSGVLRSAMLSLARQSGAPGELLRRVNLARMTSPPRANRTVARRRRLGGDAQPLGSGDC